MEGSTEAARRLIANALLSQLEGVGLGEDVGETIRYLLRMRGHFGLTAQDITLSLSKRYFRNPFDIPENFSLLNLSEDSAIVGDSFLRSCLRLTTSADFELRHFEFLEIARHFSQLEQLIVHCGSVVEAELASATTVATIHTEEHREYFMRRRRARNGDKLSDRIEPTSDLLLTVIRLAQNAPSAAKYRQLLINAITPSADSVVVLGLLNATYMYRLPLSTDEQELLASRVLAYSSSHLDVVDLLWTFLHVYLRRPQEELRSHLTARLRKLAVDEYSFRFQVIAAEAQSIINKIVLPWVVSNFPGLLEQVVAEFPASVRLALVAPVKTFVQQSLLLHSLLVSFKAQRIVEDIVSPLTVKNVVLLMESVRSVLPAIHDTQSPSNSGDNDTGQAAPPLGGDETIMSEIYEIGARTMESNLDEAHRQELVATLVRLFPWQLEDIAERAVACLPSSTHRSIITLVLPNVRRAVFLPISWYEKISQMKPQIREAFLAGLARGDEWCYDNIKELQVLLSVDAWELSPKIVACAKATTHLEAKVCCSMEALSCDRSEATFIVAMETLKQGGPKELAQRLLQIFPDRVDDIAACFVSSLMYSNQSSVIGFVRSLSPTESISPRVRRWYAVTQQMKPQIRDAFLAGLARGAEWCYDEIDNFFRTFLSVKPTDWIRQIITRANGTFEQSDMQKRSQELEKAFRFALSTEAQIDDDESRFELGTYLILSRCSSNNATDYTALSNLVELFLGHWLVKPMFVEKTVGVLTRFLQEPLSCTSRYSAYVTAVFRANLLSGLLQCAPEYARDVLSLVIGDQPSSCVLRAVVDLIDELSFNSIGVLRMAARCRPLINNLLKSALLLKASVQNLIKKSVRIGEVAVVYHLLHFGVRVGGLNRFPWDIVFLIGSFALDDPVVVPRLLRLYPTWLDWVITEAPCPVIRQAPKICDDRVYLTISDDDDDDDD